MIYISNIDDLATNAGEVRPSHLVSLVEASEQPATPPGIAADRHLRVEIHDILEPEAGCVHPQDHHIRSLVGFIDSWPAEAPLLVHCMAGVSRSTAAALIALVRRSPLSEEEAASHLRSAAPHAHPNRRMIALADALLNCGGRLIAAREAMGPARPMLRGPLVGLNLNMTLAPVVSAAGPVPLAT